MRRFVLATLVFASSAACQPAAAPLSDEDIASIRSLGQAYAEANLAKDADAVAAVYSLDAVEMPPNLPASVGNAAIRERYAEFFELDVEVSEFTITSVEVDGVDEFAFDRGTWTWTGTPPGLTAPMSENGKYLGILRRQEDGAWLWTEMIWNSDEPLPQP